MMKKFVMNVVLVVMVFFVAASVSDARILAKKANSKGFGVSFFASNGTCTLTTMWKKDSIQVLNGIGDLSGNVLAFGIADSTGIQASAAGIPSGQFLGVVVTFPGGTILTYNDVSCNGQKVLDAAAPQPGYQQAEIDAATRKIADQLRQFYERSKKGNFPQ